MALTVTTVDEWNVNSQQFNLVNFSQNVLLFLISWLYNTSYVIITLTIKYIEMNYLQNFKETSVDW